MDDSELVGGVLLDFPDPYEGATVLANLILAPRSNSHAAALAGLDPHLVEVLRMKLGSDPIRVEGACRLGAAWVAGRRSVKVADPWDLVASLPAGTALPGGLRRTTGETLVQLVVQAQTNLCLAAPFIDRPGLSFLGDALVAATARGTMLEIFLPTRSTHANQALDELRSEILQEGDPSRFVVSAFRDDAPWAHLKVLTCDSTTAYIGSANVTSAGIRGYNLELGVLVRGEMVEVVEQVLRLFRQP